MHAPAAAWSRREHSVEDEMLEIVTEAVVDEDQPVMTLAEVVAYIDRLGLARTDESTAMIREDRDRGNGRHRRVGCRRGVDR